MSAPAEPGGVRAQPRVRPAWARDSIAVRLSDVPTGPIADAKSAFGGATGRGVRVAVVDSGIDADHPRLGRSVARNESIQVLLDTWGRPYASFEHHDDAFGHGTACAGIIHAIAPEASIASIKVLGGSGGGTAPAFLFGLRWAIEAQFDIINLSLGTPRPDVALELYQLCDQAYFQNSTIVTAANNVRQISFPSLFASVVSVASNLSEDPGRFHYNPEPPTEFLARGIDVEVAWKGATTTRTTGNSFAAPHIAGHLALIKSKHPSLKPFQLKAALWTAAANVADPRAQAAGKFSRTMMAMPAHRRTGRLTRRRN